MKRITIARLLKVSSNDPEDARRRKLLTIILLGVTGLTSLMLLGVVAVSISGVLPRELIIGLGSAVLAVFVSVVFSYLINRYWSGGIASILFLSTLIAVFAFIDDPRQVVEGRTLFLFSIPILMASVILPPWASFAAAGVCSLVITVVAMLNLPDYAQGAPPIPTILGFFSVAFVSWLSARSLENALIDLRALNLDLENRVILRTKELAETNEELEAANEKLKELDRLKSDFLSTVSHELRTPLSAIQGFVEMLNAGIFGEVSKKQETAHDRILVNTKRLLELVNCLLYTSPSPRDRTRSRMPSSA